jgi:hypothetical protein
MPKPISVAPRHALIMVPNTGPVRKGAGFQF